MSEIFEGETENDTARRVLANLIDSREAMRKSRDKIVQTNRAQVLSLFDKQIQSCREWVERTIIKEA